MSSEYLSVKCLLFMYRQWRNSNSDTSQESLSEFQVLYLKRGGENSLSNMWSKYTDSFGYITQK